MNCEKDWMDGTERHQPNLALHCRLTCRQCAALRAVTAASTCDLSQPAGFNQPNVQNGTVAQRPSRATPNDPRTEF
jgi:hypothetical protein